MNKRLTRIRLIAVSLLAVLLLGALPLSTFAEEETFVFEEIREYLDKVSGVALGSDAFFPFGDNIERAKKSGVSYIAEPGGSIRDDLVIETCNKYGMVMAFTGMRLFHH